MTAILNWDVTGPSAIDADLARASAAGDKRAFAAIYDRYADRLHDYCVGMLADRDGAADCVQDTFCIAATRLPQLRDPGKLRPWLYSIARNEALRRIRERRRERPSEDVPDSVSGDPSPDTLAARSELADLIADAAGGLTDRDRAVLELAFRHGLSGPDLAEALGVTPTNANTIVHRLRDTIERSLGALLVSRRAKNVGGCEELVAILDGWDGHFNVLMRKRISRHIESCGDCDEQRRRLVSPVALLGAAPVFIPAPAWLKERTLNAVELTCAATPMDIDDAVGRADGAGRDDGAGRNTRSSLGPVMAFAVALLGALASTIVWVNLQTTTIQAPIEVSETAPATPAPQAPPSIAPSPPPPTASVDTVVPSAPPAPPQQTTAAPPPSAEPTPVVPPPVSEPPLAPAPPTSPPTLPPLPPLPPLPEWPQWPGGDPGGPDPGSQLTGPSDLAGNPPHSTVP
ncbi:MAG TPA: sigma-70 family RNA polymerase sigma factor [Mycobacterium sp.]|nr:sigma-70 family RNA polymerase sigma factor [Mycobacterium sp.]